jgi:hypothetical protein
MAMKRLTLTEQEERARRTLDLFKRLTNLSDGHIGAALGVKYQAVEQRRRGFTRIHPHRDVPCLAEALGIEPDCFYMSDEELWQWTINNRPDLVVPSSGWLLPTAAAA